MRPGARYVQAVRMLNSGVRTLGLLLATATIAGAKTTEQVEQNAAADVHISAATFTGARRRATFSGNCADERHGFRRRRRDHSDHRRQRGGGQRSGATFELGTGSRQRCLQLLRLSLEGNGCARCRTASAGATAAWPRSSRKTALLRGSEATPARTWARTSSLQAMWLVGLE